MVNKDFLDEHDALLRKHASAVQKWGTHQEGADLPEEIWDRMSSPERNPHKDPQWKLFWADWQPFLKRWRLAAMAGPYLPVPLKPLLGGFVPLPQLASFEGTGSIMYLPDTMPVPSRDSLRGILDDGLHRGDLPEHLAEWHGIVRADNMAKNRMDPFARYFLLQHFRRILQDRHPAAIRFRETALQEVFAGSLGEGSQTIAKDFIEIRKRLGADWLERPWPMEPRKASPRNWREISRPELQRLISDLTQESSQSLTADSAAAGQAGDTATPGNAGEVLGQGRDA